MKQASKWGHVVICAPQSDRQLVERWARTHSSDERGGHIRFAATPEALLEWLRTVAQPSELRADMPVVDGYRPVDAIILGVPDGAMLEELAGIAREAISLRTSSESDIVFLVSHADSVQLSANLTGALQGVHLHIVSLDQIRTPALADREEQNK